MEEEKIKTIAIDFDGVIHKYSKGWQDGSIYDEPIEGAFEAIKSLMKDYAVFVFTTRNPSMVAEWIMSKGRIHTVLKEPTDFWNDNTRLLITNKKLPAIAYIDDRGIRFTNWKDILNYF